MAGQDYSHWQDPLTISRRRQFKRKGDAEAGAQRERNESATRAQQGGRNEGATKMEVIDPLIKFAVYHIISVRKSNGGLVAFYRTIDWGRMLLLRLSQILLS